MKFTDNFINTLWRFLNELKTNDKYKLDESEIRAGEGLIRKHNEYQSADNDSYLNELQPFVDVFLSALKLIYVPGKVSEDMKIVFQGLTNFGVVQQQNTTSTVVQQSAVSDPKLSKPQYYIDAMLEKCTQLLNNYEESLKDKVEQLHKDGFMLDNEYHLIEVCEAQIALIKQFKQNHDLTLQKNQPSFNGLLYSFVNQLLGLDKQNIIYKKSNYATARLHLVGLYTICSMLSMDLLSLTDKDTKVSSIKRLLFVEQLGTDTEKEDQAEDNNTPMMVQKSEF